MAKTTAETTAMSGSTSATRVLTMSSSVTLAAAFLTTGFATTLTHAPISWSFTPMETVCTLFFDTDYFDYMGAKL